MPLSKDDWAYFQENINILFGTVHFQAGEDKLTVELRLSYERMKMEYLVYVNGYIKGEDWDTKSEVGAKYYCPKYWSTASLVNKMEKAIGKRATKKAGYKREKKLVSYSPAFPSLAALKKVFNKIEDIRLIKESS